MKLLIVGLGSMGKRRARLAKGIDAAIQIVGVDTAENRRAEAKQLGPPRTRTPRWSARRRCPTLPSSASCWTTACRSLPS